MYCASSVRADVNSSWLATGTVTKVEGSSVYMIGKDNKVYRIDSGHANMIFDERGSTQVRVGDCIRVLGYLRAPGEVEAMQVHVLGASTASTGKGPEKVVEIVVEQQSAQPPVPAPPIPAAEPIQPVQPVQPAQIMPSNWQGKGLITDIDYTAKLVKIQTSDGNYTISVSGANLSRGSTRIGLGRLNIGDTISVVGRQTGPNSVVAQNISVLRTGSEAQAAVPLMHISVVGVIQQVDYTSRTFKMTTEVTPIVVSCDDKTVIQFQQICKSFSDLKPGTRVNMSGYGSYSTGYAAQHIQIISESP